jgi:hypothetical protein
MGLLVMFLVAHGHAQNCVITIPNKPLTAAGLATPHKVTGCNQINFTNQASFVEAVILDPATGNLAIYHPLIINADNTIPDVDFIPPVTPTLPANAVVGLWFDTNGLTLTLAGDTTTCINGINANGIESIFGRFAYCNAPAFFQAAFLAYYLQGVLLVPSLGTIQNGPTVGFPCPTIRDFRVVDNNPAEGLLATYLLVGGTTLAQNTPQNAKINTSIGKGHSR